MIHDDDVIAYLKRDKKDTKASKDQLAVPSSLSEMGSVILETIVEEAEETGSLKDGAGKKTDSLQKEITRKDSTLSLKGDMMDAKASEVQTTASASLDETESVMSLEANAIEGAEVARSLKESVGKKVNSLQKKEIMRKDSMLSLKGDVKDVKASKEQPKEQPTISSLLDETESVISLETNTTEGSEGTRSLKERGGKKTGNLQKKEIMRKDSTLKEIMQRKETLQKKKGPIW